MTKTSTEEKQVVAQAQNSEPQKKIDTHSYKGWLNSDSFLKRAFSILGYMIVAQFIIQIPLMIIFFGIIAVVLLSMGISMNDISGM